MRNLKRSKLFVCVMLGLALLSFFYGAHQSVDEYPPFACGDVVTYENGAKFTNIDERVVRVDNVSAVDSARDQAILARERKNYTPIVTIHFIIVVYALFVAEQVTYWMVIRRYGCHMIALWENITYIHQTDGEKGNVFLYTV